MIRFGLIGLSIVGYFTIGLGLSTAASGLVLWATNGLPGEGEYAVFWQGQIGTALGYGLASTVIAVPLWALACLLRVLRWVKAWWLALVFANALTLTAAIVAFLRVTSLPA